MNKIYPKIIIIGLFLTIAGQYATNRINSRASNSNSIAFKQAVDLQVAQANQDAQNRQKEALKAFTLKVMDFSPSSKLSDSRKNILADKIVNIIYNNIEGEEAQQTYIVMLKKENNFVSNRTSSKGAIGLGQIMAATFKNNAKDCGLDPVVEDLNDDDINLNFGSCYFQLLLNENENNSRLANLAYSGGSKVVEHYKKTGDINKESAVYAFSVVDVKSQINKLMKSKDN